MLDRLHRLAKPLYRARLALWVLGIGAAAVFAASVLGVVEGRNVPLESFIVGLWAAFLIAFAGCFRSPPPRVDPRAGIAKRVKARGMRALLWSIAVCCVALFGFVGFLSIRAVALVLRTP